MYGAEGTENYAKPALFGMDKFRDINCYIGCRRDTLHIVPDGLELEIKWPEGIVELQWQQW